MNGLVNRWVARFQDSKRRMVVKATISCESLEGRRLLSGGFGGGGMGGYGFEGSFGQGRNGPSEMMSFSREGGSQNSPGQSQGGQGIAYVNTGPSFNGNSGGSMKFEFGSTFANGRTGSNTPFRPYMDWGNSQSPQNSATQDGADSSDTDSGSGISTSDSQSTVSASTNGPAMMSFGMDGGPAMMSFGMGGGFQGSGSGRVSSFGASGGFQGNVPGGMNLGMGGGFQGVNTNFYGNGTFGQIGAPGRSGAFTPADSSQNSDIQDAVKALQTELKESVPDGARPSFASLGTLMDDQEAIRNGTLTGTDATTKVQADETAVLTELGLTSDQITKIQEAEATLVSAVNAAIDASSSSNSDSTSDTNVPDRSHDPLKDMTDVPLLPFLSQLRQNQQGSVKGSTSGDSSSSSTSDSAETA